MKANHPSRNSIVAALLAILTIFLPASAARALDEARLDGLFAQLQQADPGEASRIEREIDLEFSRSGSATMDLLLKRGRDAVEAGRTQAAIEHLTALTDHAADFAEGFYFRALAYVQADLIGPALEDVERVLALNPRHMDAMGLLGFLMEDLGRPDMARAAYERVLDLHPHHGDAIEALARLAPELNGQDL